MNSNISPYDEYQKRLHEFMYFCKHDGFRCLELDYDERQYEQAASAYSLNQRAYRCKACYSMRLDAIAHYACEQGYDAISTTLSVSPYQNGPSIKAALEHAAQRYGVLAMYRDFTSEYEASVIDSRELGMYRQNYCGCRFSAFEAEKDRVQAKKDRHFNKALFRALKRI